MWRGCEASSFKLLLDLDHTLAELAVRFVANRIGRRIGPCVNCARVLQLQVRIVRALSGATHLAIAAVEGIATVNARPAYAILVTRIGRAICVHSATRILRGDRTSPSEKYS